MMKVGTIYFDRNGSSGNIYAIMGSASRLLKMCGWEDRAEEMFNRVTSSGSYDEALKIIGEYVTLKERKERY